MKDLNPSQFWVIFYRTIGILGWLMRMLMARGSQRITKLRPNTWAETSWYWPAVQHLFRWKIGKDRWWFQPISNFSHWVPSFIEEQWLTIKHVWNHPPNDHFLSYGQWMGWREQQETTCDWTKGSSPCDSMGIVGAMLRLGAHIFSLGIFPSQAFKNRNTFLSSAILLFHALVWTFLWNMGGAPVNVLWFSLQPTRTHPSKRWSIGAIEWLKVLGNDDSLHGHISYISIVDPSIISHISIRNASTHPEDSENVHHRDGGGSCAPHVFG